MSMLPSSAIEKNSKFLILELMSLVTSPERSSILRCTVLRLSDNFDTNSIFPGHVVTRNLTMQFFTSSPSLNRFMFLAISALIRNDALVMLCPS